MATRRDDRNRPLIERRVIEAAPRGALPLEVLDGESVCEVFNKGLFRFRESLNALRRNVTKTPETSRLIVVTNFIVRVRTLAADMPAPLRELTGRDSHFFARIFLEQKNHCGKERDVVVKIEKIEAASALGVISIGLKLSLNRQLQLRGF